MPSPDDKSYSRSKRVDAARVLLAAADRVDERTSFGAHARRLLGRQRGALEQRR